MSPPRHLPETISAARWTCSTASGPSPARRICAAGNGVISGSKPAATPRSPFARNPRRSFHWRFHRTAPGWRWECVHQGGVAVWDLRTRQVLTHLGGQRTTGSRRLFTHGTAAGLHQLHRYGIRSAAVDFTAVEHRDATDGRRIAAGRRVRWDWRLPRMAGRWSLPRLRGQRGK